MANLNPMQLLQLLKSNNPRMVVEQIIQQGYPNNPTMNQLLQLGQQGNVTEIENFARQFFTEQGKDYDVEKQRLMSAINQLGR
jgi:hypothetical protein